MIPENCRGEIWHIDRIKQLRSSDIVTQKNVKTLSEVLDVIRFDDRYQKIMKSIDKHGFCSYLGSDGEVLFNGHHRLAAAVDLGYLYLPMVIGPRAEAWKFSHQYKQDNPIIARPNRSV